jgi:pectate lyase
MAHRAGSLISIQTSHNVWVDHVDLFNDNDHDPDYYGVPLKIFDSSSNVTVTYSKFHDAFKATVADSGGEPSKYICPPF